MFNLDVAKLQEPPLARLRLVIDGIEVSQAIQYFDAAEHLTDPADRGVNDAVQLVAYKPARVRVYAWSIFGAEPVIATLEVRRRVYGFIWGPPVALLSPDAGSMTSTTPAGQSYATTRGSASGSLNFTIPASEMVGTLRLTAKLQSGSWRAEQSIDVGVTLYQQLRLAGVMISYNGPASSAVNAPNLTIAAPTLADLQAMAGTALTLFPVESVASFRTAGALVQTNHLQDTSFPTSGCGTQWDALHGRVANARTADGNKPGWIYYGLLPNGVPMGPVGGCGGGGVAVGPVREPWTLAHEAGHACGLEHAPSGGAPNPDPNFPAYEPYDPANTAQGRDGEYGIDVNNGNIAAPQTFRDVMGYAWPKWISLYHYGRLLNNARLSPTTIGVDHPWWRDLVYREKLHWPPDPPGDPPPFDLGLAVYPPMELRDVISLIVKVENGKVVDVPHVARTRAYPSLPGGRATDLVAQLKDTDGVVISTGTPVQLRTSACGCGVPDGHLPKTYLAQVFLADVGIGASLEIVDGDDVLWRRTAPETAPGIEKVSTQVDEAGDVTLSWDASDGVEEFWVRWSATGEEWQSVATDVHDREIRMEAGNIPSGKGFLQVVAHDGYSSAYSEPIEVTVAERPAQLVILHPEDGFTYLAGQNVHLWASASYTSYPRDIDATWFVDGDEIARGIDAWGQLDVGEHTLSVRLAGDDRDQSVIKVLCIAPVDQDSAG